LKERDCTGDLFRGRKVRPEFATDRYGITLKPTLAKLF
jgi:hypothetical protein